MTTLDIRKKQDDEITGIRFDDSSDIIVHDYGDSIGIAIVGKVSGYPERFLSSYDDLDNFIAACKKAKELWGK